MSIQGHSHFIATNVRSSKTYRIDSMSFPTGTFTWTDCHAPVGNWMFGICDCNSSHAYSETANRLAQV